MPSRLFPVRGLLDAGAVRQRDDCRELVARDVSQRVRTKGGPSDERNDQPNYRLVDNVFTLVLTTLDAGNSVLPDRCRGMPGRGIS